MIPIPEPPPRQRVVDGELHEQSERQQVGGGQYARQERREPHKNLSTTSSYFITPKYHFPSNKQVTKVDGE